MEYSAPQIAGRDEPFRSAIREHLKGHTQGLEDLAVEMLARGLSVRDIECLQGRKRSASSVEERGVTARGAAVGGLSSFCPARFERIRDCLLVCRRHRRTVAASNANRFWLPGALRWRAVGCCCI